MLAFFSSMSPSARRKIAAAACEMGEVEESCLIFK